LSHWISIFRPTHGLHINNMFLNNMKLTMSPHYIMSNAFWPPCGPVLTQPGGKYLCWGLNMAQTWATH
jgi:hypothetical protein